MSGFLAISNVSFYGIEVECSPQQSGWLRRNIDHLAAWPTDADRVRFVFKGGRKGPWFSRLWRPLTFEQVA